ncbi:MAG: hypothetical protein AAGF66_20330 [Cyanobacteria bacterium P01_H01_bin.119]
MQSQNNDTLNAQTQTDASLNAAQNTARLQLAAIAKASKTTGSVRRMFSHWVMEEGKLVCKWEANR